MGDHNSKPDDGAIDEVESLNRRLSEMGFGRCRFEVDEDGMVFFIDDSSQDCFTVSTASRAEQILEELGDYIFHTEHERHCRREHCSICGRP